MHIRHIPESPIFPKSDDKTAAHISPAWDWMDHDPCCMYCSLFRILCDSVCVKENSYFIAEFSIREVYIQDTDKMKNVC